MNALPTPVSGEGSHVARDPISAAVENYIRTLEAKGSRELRTHKDAAGIHVSFGTKKGSGEDYDIALVRLARVMIEDAEYSGALMGALRGLMTAQNA